MTEIKEIYSQSERVRIDVFVSTIADVTRSRAAKLVTDGLVFINGKVASKSDKPQAGDEVTVHLPDPQPYDVLPQNLNLDIVFEDDDLLVVN